MNQSLIEKETAGEALLKTPPAALSLDEKHRLFWLSHPYAHTSFRSLIPAVPRPNNASKAAAGTGVGSTDTWTVSVILGQ